MKLFNWKYFALHCILIPTVIVIYTKKVTTKIIDNPGELLVILIITALTCMLIIVVSNTLKDIVLRNKALAINFLPHQIVNKVYFTLRLILLPITTKYYGDDELKLHYIESTYSTPTGIIIPIFSGYFRPSGAIRPYVTYYCYLSSILAIFHYLHRDKILAIIRLFPEFPLAILTLLTLTLFEAKSNVNAILYIILTILTIENLMKIWTLSYFVRNISVFIPNELVDLNTHELIEEIIVHGDEALKNSSTFTVIKAIIS